MAGPDEKRPARILSNFNIWVLKTAASFCIIKKIGSSPEGRTAVKAAPVDTALGEAAAGGGFRQIPWRGRILFLKKGFSWLKNWPACLKYRFGGPNAGAASEEVRLCA